MTLHTLEQEQHLPITMEEAWDFFSSPGNLNEITPAEQRRMFEKVKPVYDKNRETIGNDAINVVFDALKKARGG